MLSFLKGLGKWLMGTSDNVKTIVDTTTSFIDNAVFTNEEKSQANMQQLKMFIAYQQSTQPQNVARREIAQKVVLLWGILILSMVIGRPFSVEFADFVFKVLKEIVMIPFSGIMTFYFLTHVLRVNKK